MIENRLRVTKLSLNLIYATLNHIRSEMNATVSFYVTPIWKKFNNLNICLCNLELRTITINFRRLVLQNV